MHIGISTAAYYGKMETEASAARLSSLGAACCEVFLQTYSEYTGAFGALVRENLGATRAVSIHTKTQHFEADLLAQSARQAAEAFAMFRGALEAGRMLGAGICVYHGPAVIRGGNPRIERWRERIERAAALAREYGIDLAWETVSWCHLNSPERVRAFRTVWPGLHYVLDIKQVYELGHRPQDYIEAMGDRLRHVHVLDHDEAGRYCLPGRGVFDFRALARGLRDAGYAGDIIVEPYADAVPSDEALMASVAWLSDIFQLS